MTSCHLEVYSTKGMIDGVICWMMKRELKFLIIIRNETYKVYAIKKIEKTNKQRKNSVQSLNDVPYSLVYVVL